MFRDLTGEPVDNNFNLLLVNVFSYIGVLGFNESEEVVVKALLMAPRLFTDEDEILSFVIE